MAKSRIPKAAKEIIDELYDGANLTNKKRIDLLVRTLEATVVPADQGGVMSVESIVSSKDARPLVLFQWGDKRGELTPAQARGYCMQILAATEAGVQDAALIAAVKANDGSEDQAYGLIKAVREFRGQFEKEEDAK
jgi:hypothetical protein